MAEANNENRRGKKHEREVLACQELPPCVTAASEYGIEVACQKGV